MEPFLVCTLLYSHRIWRLTRKIRTRKNSAFRHFSRSALRYKYPRICYDHRETPLDKTLAASVCVCVCVCVCVLPSTVKALFVWIKWDTREHIHDVMLKTLNSYADSLHRYFRMQNLAFLLAALSCSWTRSGQSHDLTSARLAFRTWDLHSRFSRRRLPYALPRKSICFHTCHSREG